MMEKQTGRIMRSLSGFYEVQTPKGLITCRGRGSLRKGGESPLTGDMVEITVEHGKGMVERILPRRNRFVRPAVANVDALVVFAANVNPVTEPFLIDRVAAIAGDQEVQVILCVNKCDLDPAVDLVRIYQNAGFSVIRASAETGEGVEELRSLLRGKLTIKFTKPRRCELTEIIAIILFFVISFKRCLFYTLAMIRKKSHKIFF